MTGGASNIDEENMNTRLQSGIRGQFRPLMLPLWAGAWFGFVPSNTTPTIIQHHENTPF